MNRINVLSKDEKRIEIKNMLRQFLPLLCGIALQQLLALIVNMVDNFMLGAYDETAMSGAALVNQIQFTMQQLTSGIGAGVSVLGAQYWGRKEIVPIKKIISVGVKFALATGMLFTIVTRLFPVQILSLFTDDEAVIAAAADYLSIMFITYVIFAFSSVLMYSLQCVQTAFIGMIMSGMTICINAVLNYILIYGNLGAQKMGIRGAAIATLTSRIVELITILVYILCKDKKLRMNIKDILGFDGMYLKDFFKAAFPLMISGALWGVAQAAQTAILGHVSAQAIGANSIASVFFQIFSVFGMSCATASSVIMGKTVGEEKPELIRPFTKTFQCIFLIMGVISGLLLFTFKGPILSFYNISQETKELADRFMLILSFATIGSCYEFPVMGGIIAGGGNPKYQAIIDMTFMWIYVIPFAYLSAFVFGWPPVVTFFILKSDQFIKCIPNAIVCNRYKWVKNLTRH